MKINSRLFSAHLDNAHGFPARPTVAQKEHRVGVAEGMEDLCDRKDICSCVGCPARIHSTAERRGYESVCWNGYLLRLCSADWLIWIGAFVAGADDFFFFFLMDEIISTIDNNFCDGYIPFWNRWIFKYWNSSQKQILF